MKLKKKREYAGYILAKIEEINTNTVPFTLVYTSETGIKTFLHNDEQDIGRYSNQQFLKFIKTLWLLDMEVHLCSEPHIYHAVGGKA